MLSAASHCHHVAGAAAGGSGDCSHGPCDGGKDCGHAPAAAAGRLEFPLEAAEVSSSAPDVRDVNERARSVGMPLCTCAWLC